MGSTVQVGSWEIKSNDESAADMVKALKGPEDKKEPKVILDRGKAPEKDERDPAAVALGKKGGEAAARAREAKAKEAPVDKPVDTAEDAEPAKSQPDKAEAVDKGEDKGEPVPAKPRHDLTARVQQLTSERRMLMERLADLEARVRTQERPEAKPVEAHKADPGPQDTAGKPAVDEYATYEEYVEALADWKSDQKLKAWESKREAERIQQQRQSEAQKRQEGFRSKVAARADEWSQVDPRLLSMMAEAPPILELGSADEVGPANYITEAITQSEDPTGFALFLSQNEDVVKDLFQSSPWALPMKLGKLEARFAKEAREERREAPRTSQAPPPVRPLTTSAQPDDDPTKEQSFDSFMRNRKKRG